MHSWPESRKNVGRNRPAPIHGDQAIKHAVELVVKLWILRAIASLLAGLLVFCAVVLLLATLAAAAIAQDDVYAEALAQQDAYDRIYSEVLTLDTLTDIHQRLLPDFDLLSSQEALALLRDVAPPDYLQGQTESILRQLSMYIGGDSDQLKLYLDIAEPLEHIGAALNELIEALAHEEIALLIREAGPLIDALEEELDVENEGDLASLVAEGNPAQTIAELTGMSREKVLNAADVAMDEVLNSPEVPVQYRQALMEAQGELLASFAEGTNREFLGKQLRVLARPAIGGAMADLDLDLNRKEQLDLVPIIAEQLYDSEERGFHRNAASLRDSLRQIILWGRVLALVLFVAAVGLLALVHWRKPALLVLWTGILLTLSGALLLVATLLALLLLPGAAERAAYQGLLESVPWAPGLASLGSDVAGQALWNILLGLTWLAATTLAAGCLVLAALLGRQQWRAHLRKKQGREEEIPTSAD